MTDTTPELKACPFCEVELAFDDGCWVHPGGDCIIEGMVDIAEGDTGDYKRWNRRADDERAGELVNLCWKVLRYEWLSDECSPPGTPTRGYPQFLADELRAAIEPHFDK